MAKVRERLDVWAGRIVNAATFWSWAFPAGAGAVIAYLSTGVSWIAALGAFGWAASGILGFVLVSAGLALLGRNRLYRAEAKMKERIAGDSSDFDPMAKVYQNKRLYLRDLAPLGRKQVHGKRFINCEIIGPGTAIIGLSTAPEKSPSVMKDCNTWDVDCIEIDANKISNLAIAFWDCDFDGCDFYHMTLLFVQRSNETLHWMTPDFRQMKMLEDKSGEPDPKS